MAPLLVAEGIGKDFDDRPVLADVSLELTPGRTLALLGPNGSGKTTLVQVLALLLRPTRGQVLFEGRDARKSPESVRRRLGFASHQSGLYLDFSPLENLTLFGRLYRVPDAARRAMALIERFGLGRFRAEPVRVFSRGMTQRLILAKALLHDPAVLLLDEPSAGLDAQGEQLLVEILDQERRAGKAILLVTHDLRIGHAAATDGLVLAGGRVRQQFRFDSLALEAVEARYRSALAEARCAIS